MPFFKDSVNWSQISDWDENVMEYTHTSLLPQLLIVVVKCLAIRINFKNLANSAFQ
jgi:hypothetical protein